MLSPNSPVRPIYRVELILHLALLALYAFGIGIYLQEAWSGYDALARISNTFIAVAMPAVFYGNVFWLIPTYLTPRRWGAYISLLIGCLLMLGFLQASILAGIRTQSGFPFFPEFRDFLFKDDLLSGPLSLSLIISYAYRFTRDWLVHLALIERLKGEKNVAELAFLKSQIDPHFLFNVLNTLYAMALEEKSPQTADGIARLGSLMRYTLHDAQTEYIPLSKEIEFLQQYITLQQLRVSDVNAIHAAIPEDIDPYNNWTIAPMLLVPFVENAFKHGTSSTAEARIDIEIRMQSSKLVLTVENSLLESPGRSNPSGIGLENVQNRLDLIYPNRYVLSQEIREEKFRVYLELDLST